MCFCLIQRANGAIMQFPHQWPFLGNYLFGFIQKVRFCEMRSSDGQFVRPFDRERGENHWFIIQLNDSLVSCFRGKERSRVSVPSSNLRHPMFFSLKSIYQGISQGNRKIRSVKHWSHWPISLYLIPDDYCFLACYDNQFPFSPRWKQ